MIENLGDRADIILLSETKCETKCKVQDRCVFQTKNSKKGGAMAWYTSRNAKLVKAVD
jgi:hypothetical protein